MGEGREVMHSFRAPASFVSGTAILRAWLHPAVRMAATHIAGHRARHPGSKKGRGPGRRHRVCPPSLFLSHREATSLATALSSVPSRFVSHNIVTI